jgi:hypothetical protein
MKGYFENLKGEAHKSKKRDTKREKVTNTWPKVNKLHVTPKKGGSTETKVVKIAILTRHGKY